MKKITVSQNDRYAAHNLDSRAQLCSRTNTHVLRVGSHSRD